MDIDIDMCPPNSSIDPTMVIIQPYNPDGLPTIIPGPVAKNLHAFHPQPWIGRNSMAISGT